VERRSRRGRLAIGPLRIAHHVPSGVRHAAFHSARPGGAGGAGDRLRAVLEVGADSSSPWTSETIGGRALDSLTGRS
jgi:hypothetical protein